jgi:hypothetical protein
MRGVSKHLQAQIRGFSVQAREGLSIEELCRVIPHSQIGVATVDALGRLGYVVHQTPGLGFHATVQVPEEWSLEAATQLADLFVVCLKPG